MSVTKNFRSRRAAAKPLRERKVRKMKEHKPRKIDTFIDKYFSTVVYEYRGMTYEVEYANGMNCCCTPAYIQHRDAQAKIDASVENPKPNREAQPIDLDEIWKMLGWD